jgi:hypothetical protein
MLLLAALAAAEAKTDPNSLTPKEIEEGWILLFDGKTSFGWQIDGEARVENGELVLGGTKATTAQPTANFGGYELRIDHMSGGPLAGSGKDLPLRVDAGKVARIQGIKLRPLGLHSIFNGKNLAGWKKFEGNPMTYKSEFSVTDDGCIHLVNGKGDLQTEALYDDFVLQIECRTNGPHLNSGVFFRCIPGLYQQGYEAQIHNWFLPEPKREYTIEDYDPKTNELKSKTKVKATATDFGTGAIYRRIPARGPASVDKEWFTMTIVANGRHLATWVNGVQQTDWVDNRPINKNARDGCRLEKGAISLQGHDKTTDLNFRNIRIAELPTGK